jgi:hypothetical protein
MGCLGRIGALIILGIVIIVVLVLIIINYNAIGQWFSQVFH